MLNVTLLTVGKLKENYLREACAEYAKRLGAFCKLQVVEVEEYRLPQNPSPAQIEAGLAAEGAVLLQKIPAGSFMIALCIEGKMLTSEKLAQQIETLAQTGASRLVFVIGGSHGLWQELKAKADLQLSMSPMTFPHQLARVMLLEQLYRAMSISAGTKYHK